MKKLVEIKEEKIEGFDLLMGEVITLFCLNYIYTGKLVGINQRYIKIEDASIVYETGAFTDKQWKDAQKLPHPVYIMKGSIESFMILK